MTDDEWMKYQPADIPEHSPDTCDHPLCNEEPPADVEARRLEIALRKTRDAA